MNQIHITRCPQNPILTKDMCPYRAELVFNAGVVRYQGIYYMIFRNDREHVGGTVFAHMDLGMASSRDGIHFEVYPEPVFRIEELNDPEILRLYDVRLSVIEGKVYAMMAVETRHGLRAGIGITEDFIHLRMVSMSLPDNRNLVLFPEKINGMYIRMERPFSSYANHNYDIWMSESPDMTFWGNSSLLITHDCLSNAKIGPGTPPIRTEKGWLAVIHAVDYDESRGKNGYEPTWKKRYCAYAALFDLDNPHKVLGISKEAIMIPEAPYEISGGFRNNVIFPMALIPEGSDTVRIYYGASDSRMAMAEASVTELVEACLQ